MTNFERFWANVQSHLIEFNERQARTIWDAAQRAQQIRIDELEEALLLALEQTEEPCPPFTWIRNAEQVLEGKA